MLKVEKHEEISPLLSYEKVVLRGQAKNRFASKYDLWLFDSCSYSELEICLQDLRAEPRKILEFFTGFVEIQIESRFSR